MRQDADVFAHPAEILHPGFAPFARLVLFRHGKPRHREQEARIDAVIAGLDAFATQHAGPGPPFGLRRAGPEQLRGQVADDLIDTAGLDEPTGQRRRVERQAALAVAEPTLLSSLKG